MEPADVDYLRPEKEEKAMRNEQYDKNASLIESLEIRYNNVVQALKKIAEGDNYGICEERRSHIEKARLEANPTAKKCMEH